MVGASKRPITTKGGMTILPDLTVDEITHETSAILLLPGADNWNDPEHAPVVEKAKQLLDVGGNVAAICGATTALADSGLLDDRQHTSNSLEYLTLFCPTYKGAACYKDEKIVVDGNLITTGAAGGLLLAREVIALLDLFKNETLEAWYNYFNTGDCKYFYNIYFSQKSCFLPGLVFVNKMCKTRHVPNDCLDSSNAGAENGAMPC